MEKAIRQAIITHSKLLLIPPVDRKKKTPKPEVAVAESMQDVQSVPEAVTHNLIAILQFQSVLLRNSTSKALYASVEKMADLLAAADDDLADNALTVLMSLAVPPDLYKQQSPDSSTVNASTALHNSKTQCHARVTACAVGWGTRAQGLGLEAVVSADDASDPQAAGSLDFGYYASDAQEISRICMEPLEIFRDKDEMSVEESISDESSASKKRRRVMETKTTAEIFFQALQKAGGRSKIPQDRIFSLLADIRLARSFHSRALRIRAVERRLKALVTITHAHPSQEVMTGYFQAQPELCVEIVDLLRPTISSAHVSANAASHGILRHHDAIAGLAQGTSIPLEIQVLAVELLTALVCRRDGSTAALSGTSRMPGVFVELGLGKGQYMGVLPTLVRYTLAALTADPPTDGPPDRPQDNDPCVDIGLDFVQATMPRLSSRPQLVLSALSFVEQVLTLTSTIVSNATGAAALTEAGLIPSVLSLISIPTNELVKRLLGSHSSDESESTQIRAKVRFVTAQVLQILEAAVVTHSHSLTAFQDLQGVEALVSRLAGEIGVSEEESDDPMETDKAEAIVNLQFSERVLLYGLFTCLTVVFHQEPSSALAAASSQAGSVQMRKPALCRSIKKVLEHVVSYGGHIVYLVSTLLVDVMNNDPQIVRQVHKSGIARSFLSMVSSTEPDTGSPVIPPVGDLISTLPNVLAALALTEDGAQVVFDSNPFPGLLKVYYCPKYAMPLNRCLLNDITSFIGTGLEEVMRHVDKLKPLIIDAIVGSLRDIKQIADDLATREREVWTSPPSLDLMNARSALIQCILNGGQILEHILQNVDNVTPFADAGGLDVVLSLFRATLPRGRQFLAHTSALSSPSVSTLHHSTVEDVLFVSLRCIVEKYDPVKLTRKLASLATEYLESYDQSICILSPIGDSSSVLERLPLVPLHDLEDKGDSLNAISSFFIDIASLHWASSCIGMAIKTLIRRGEDTMASSYRRNEREWKKEIISESFQALLLRLAEVHQKGILQLCQIRASLAYKERESARMSSRNEDVTFRLRIVCPEGAIVRDGIEIDSCASVGSMSMGETADAFDRCINSNGIMRYRTSRGWVSEMTRGHGREPITEVIDIVKSKNDEVDESLTGSAKRLEQSLPDLQTVGCGVMARLQSSYHELVGAISKVTVHNVRKLETGTLIFEEGTPAGIAKKMIRILADMTKKGFAAVRTASGTAPFIGDASIAMYLGFLVDSLHSCLFDEKRERRIVNLPLLLNLTGSQGIDFGFFDVLRHLFEHCLHAFEVHGQERPAGHSISSPISRVNRSVAAAFPPLVRFLRRLVCTPISVSPLASILSRLKWDQIPSISGDEDIRSLLLPSSPDGEFFEPEAFALSLHSTISDIVHGVWMDQRLQLAPSFLVHPLTGLVGEIIVALEDSGKKKPQNRSSRSLSDVIRANSRVERDAFFEASDEAIEQLAEMGFSRDHALEALEMSGTNRVEVAMEYALSHPPPSAESAERRRNERADRQRRRQERNQEPIVPNDGDASRETSTGDESKLQESKEDATTITVREKSENGVQERLSRWIETAAPVCAGILSGPGDAASNYGSVEGNAEREAVTVVLCSFLFDLCYRYPDSKYSIVKVLFDKLKIVLVFQEDGTFKQSSLASLCHAVTLLARALPKTKLMVLECSLVGDVVDLVSRQVKTMTQNPGTWPDFLSPALLLLEAMAQPMIAFHGKDPLKDFSDKYKDAESLPSELSAVYHQHMEQRKSFSFLGNSMFTIVHKEENKKTEAPGTEQRSNPFDLIPSFSPLLPKESVPLCIEICKSLLCTQQHSATPPPAVVQGTLMLLLQLLRDPLVASECSHDGLADQILNLPPSCRFTGNTGLVTLVLRRLMEDESSLQAALEIEVRTAVARILAKEKDSPGSEDASIPIEKFLEAVTPLVCRDQMSFIRAMWLSVKLENSAGGQVMVRRLNQQEKLIVSKTIAESLSSSGQPPAEKTETMVSPIGKRRSSSVSSPKGKSSSRNVKRSSGKRSRSLSQTAALPAASTVSSLVHLALTTLAKERSEEYHNSSGPFLFASELLDILADLILAVPACSVVVHNCRPFKNNENLLKSLTKNGFKHALTDAVHPPKTLSSFLLHVLLGADRWSILRDWQLWEQKTKENTNAATKERKRSEYQVLKTTQGAARVLSALALRPGEGRKRVIEDLVFALSAGYLGHGHTTPNDKILRFSSRESSVHALQAWGELCLGLIFPRAPGKTLEGSSSIRVENVKSMLDCGMVHALLFALHHVPLSHPMAPRVCEALLLPIEVLIRPTVSSAVKEFAGKSPSKVSKNTDQMSGDQERDQNAVSSNEMELETLVEVNSQERSSDVDDDMDVDLGNEEASNGSAMSQDDGVDEDSSIEETESEMEEEDEDDSDSSELDDDVEIDSGEVSDGTGWVEGNGDLVVHESDGDLEESNDEMAVLDQGIEEGWTRVESTNFGGMFTGTGAVNAAQSGRRGFAIHASNIDARNRGFIDAAEAMIGSLLRSGEISSDALAEIEGTLGVRISHQLLSRRGDAPNGLRENVSSESPLQVGISGGRREIIGTVPHVHQRSQPEMGYAYVTNGSRPFEVSSLEYVFGGPSVTSSSRNYDTVTPIDLDESAVPSLSQNDLQLFPSGPGALGGGTQLSLHPLLCGVDLPPVNSIVSDLLPHGVRSRRQGHLTTRRPGEWSNPSMNQGGYLVATANGNIIRSNRSNSWVGNGVSGQDISGPVGWTDDGLPFDSTVGDLTSALGEALTESAARAIAADNEVESGDTSPGDNADAAVHEAPAASSPSSGEADSAAHDAVDESNFSAEPPQHEQDTTNIEVMAESDTSPRSATDGDQVASSLASGLRLSPNGDSRSLQEDEEGSDEMAEIHRTENEEDTGTARPADSAVDLEVARNDGNQETQEASSASVEDSSPIPNAHGLVCPPDIDPEVFESLPLDMQQDLVSQHAATQELAAQVEGTSIDPDVLAELPEDMRNEILEQQRREREARERDEAPVDPSRAEAMDNASFLASVEPALREEILLTADDAFLSTLPAGIRAEADVLRERALAQRRSMVDNDAGLSRGGQGSAAEAGDHRSSSEHHGNARRRQRNGKVKVDIDREEITFLPDSLSPPVAKADLELVTALLHLLSPIRPHRLMHQLVLNMSTNAKLRAALTGLFVGLLHDDNAMALKALDEYRKVYKDDSEDWRSMVDKSFSGIKDFPPKRLIGAAPDLPESDVYSINISASLLRQKHGIGTAASMAANLPKSSVGPNAGSKLPPVVTNRILDVFLNLCKASPRFCVHLLEKTGDDSFTFFDCLLDLLARPTFYKSASNLDQLLTLLESVVSPLSHLQRGKDEEYETSEKELEAAESQGKTYVDVPRVSVNQSRLKLLCSILRIEACRDTAFNKVNTIIRRLCRIEDNRGYVLQELASVAHSLGADAVRDLRSLRIRMEQTSARKKALESNLVGLESPPQPVTSGSAATSVALSSTSSESKLLRVLQTLHSLCADPGEESTSRKHDTTIIVTGELVHLLCQMQFDDLWTELSACLKVVHVLEGVHQTDEVDAEDADEESGDDLERGGKKLRNSSAGLLSRFLPAIEAFLIANASTTRQADSGDSTESEEISVDNLVGGQRLIEFVSSNRVLLNALVRNNTGLLDKGLRALVQVPRCRQFLEFDVKRGWFKAQMRRLRQHASRRHGSLRLHIRRDRVFQEAYNYLRLRNADEMRGRLHVTFQNEEGVDAGGLSREFFAILAKEMFNPNYALFTATEDGCTFQPNQNSGINPDHMSFFRFVGRIVGKALADGYLLDAHFTRSLYKHMLGMEPTHHDMEAIDPDYYRNLKTILEFNLEDIGLDHLTFSIEERSFGRTQTIDLEPGGRNIAVTEENKKEYVHKICQYRMTTAIKNQIKAYLDGFHELINPELISIFTPRELELMISGLPDIDIDDLKKNTEYTGWRPVDKEIGWFWKIMYALSRDEKAKFLQFVTGSSKVPLAGFSELQGMRGTKKFTINKDSSGGSKGALMSAHTCFNTLDLPVYQSEEELREKLLLAINEGGGAFFMA